MPFGNGPRGKSQLTNTAKLLGEYSKYSDEALVAMLKNSDEYAFKQLYDRYKTAVSIYAINLLRNESAATDILQEAFLSLWKRREEIEIKISFQAWLYKTVRNLCIKDLADSSKQSEFIQRLTKATEQYYNDPRASFEIKEMTAQIEAVVKSMPERMQSAFVMSRSEDLSHREVGEHLSMAEGTVKKHVQNALKLIKKQVLNIPATVIVFLVQLFF